MSLRAILAIGLAATAGAVSPAKILGAGDESSLEVPSLRVRQRAGARLMRQEASALQMYPVEDSHQDSAAAYTTCAPLMKVSKDWEMGDKHAMRTGIFRMQRQKQFDGTPLYKNEMGMYLYYWNITQEWRIGWDFNRPHAGVSSPPSGSVCPDLAPEWWAFVNGSWTTREGFTVLPEVCAPVVTISGAEMLLPQLMGEYRMSTNCSACPADFGAGCPCRPVYQNTRAYAHGSWTYYLFFWFEFGEWRVGTDINASAAAITSLEGENAACPALASGWEVFVDFKWQRNEDLLVQRKSAKGSIYDDFQVGSSNTNSCPEMTVAMNESRCETVAEDVEKDYGGSIEDEDKPKGCFEAHGTMGKVYFNTAETGNANQDSYLICERTEEYWNHALANSFGPSTTKAPPSHKTVQMHESEHWFDENDYHGSGASEASHASGAAHDAHDAHDASHESHASGEEYESASHASGEESHSSHASEQAMSHSSEASVASDASSSASGVNVAAEAHGSHGDVADREVEAEEVQEKKQGAGKKIGILVVAALVLLIMFFYYRRRKAAAEKADAAAKEAIKPVAAAGADEKAGEAEAAKDPAAGEQPAKA